MPRIAWITDEEAPEETAAALAQVRSPNGEVVPLIRAMSRNPTFMVKIWEARRALFGSGAALSPAHFHLIAAYVSLLTKCHF